MKSYKIYREDSVVYDFVVDDNISESLSGNKYISFTITSKEELDIRIGDYIFAGNEKYELFEPIDLEESSGVFTYPLTFYWQGYKLNNVIITDEGATTFAYHGEVSDFMTLLIQSLNVDYPEFSLGKIEDGSILDLNFDNSNCMAALQTVCENADMEWDIVGTTINVKKRIGEETDYVFEYGKNKGSYSVKLSKVANASITTRMIGKGGTINLPADYSSPDSPKRLNLGGEVLEKNVEKYGKITGVYTNENIYPRLINKTVLAVTVPENIEEAGSWKIKLDIPFNLSEYYADNEVPLVKFQTGDLTGLEFEIVEDSWNDTEKTLSIITKEETNGYYIPNENRQPRVGDVFVLLNIYMPQSYVDEATAELRKATHDELDRKCEPQYAPSLSLQKHYIKKKNISLHIGDGITVKIGKQRITTRIIGLTESSSRDEISVELGDQMLYTYDTKVNNTLEQIQTTLKQLISIEDIRRLFYNLINAWYPKWFNQKLHKDANVKFGSVQSDNISSENFTSGALGSGHRIKDGDAEFQNLTVRGQFSVFEYLIQQVKAIGGKFCVSPASMKIGQVEELEDGYKCSFNTDDGTIRNPFIVGDQAFHQVYEGKKMNRYWRLVTEVGSDYFILSKSDCEANSGVPEPDDEIVLLGNRTDRNRQSAIMISAYDENSPYIAYYAGINSYSFEGKEPMRTGNLNGIVDEDFGQLAGFGMFCENVYMKGVFRLMSGKTVEQAVSEVQSNIDNLQIGTENLISWKMMLEWNKKNKDIAVYGMDGDGVYLEINHGLLYEKYGGIGGSISNSVFNINFKENTQYVLSVEWKGKSIQDYSLLNFVFVYTDGTNDRCTLGGKDTTKTIKHLISRQGKTVSYIGTFYGSYDRSLIYNISLIEGNKPLQGFPVATDDLPNNINLADGTKEFTVTAGSGENWKFQRLYMPKIKPNTAYYVSWDVENLIGSPSFYSAILYNKNISYAFNSTDLKATKGGILVTLNDFVEQDGYLLLYAGEAGSTQGNSVKYTNVMLVEGRFPATAYSPSVNEQEKKIAEFEVTLDGFNSRFTSLGNSVSAIEQKTNSIELSVTSVSEESKRYAFGQSWSSGKIMKGDPSFIKGQNGAYVYNNRGDGTVTVTREAKQSDSPVTSSGYNLKIVSSGSATPGGGGFCQSLNSRANAIFLHRFIAKVPSGCSLGIGTNSLGNGGYQYWCTSNKGTGKWEEYIYATHCGPSGKFSTFGYVYLSPAANVTWYLAYADVFDVTNGAAPVNTGNIVNSINVSTEGIRIDASKLTISGQTLFKDSNGNSVSIFGTGDNVFTINGGVFNVNKYGKVSASSVEISGESTFGNLKVVGSYFLAKDSWVLQFGARGHSRNKIEIGLGDPNGTIGLTAMSIDHEGMGIQLAHDTNTISNSNYTKLIGGALTILEGTGKAISSGGKCYFNLLGSSFDIENGSVKIACNTSITGAVSISNTTTFTKGNASKSSLYFKDLPTQGEIQPTLSKYNFVYLVIDSVSGRVVLQKR